MAAGRWQDWHVVYRGRGWGHPALRERGLRRVGGSKAGIKREDPGGMNKRGCALANELSVWGGREWGRGGGDGGSGLGDVAEEDKGERE